MTVLRAIFYIQTMEKPRSDESKEALSSDFKVIIVQVFLPWSTPNT